MRWKSYGIVLSIGYMFVSFLMFAPLCFRILPFAEELVTFESAFLAMGGGVVLLASFVTLGMFLMMSSRVRCPHCKKTSELQISLWTGKPQLRHEAEKDEDDV